MERNIFPYSFIPALDIIMQVPDISQLWEKSQENFRKGNEHVSDGIKDLR
jgi:hypothetical protein